MNKCTQILSAALVVVASFSPVFAQDKTHSGQAVNNSAKASGHASGSAAHSIAASGQVTSAVLAVPLSMGGAALVTSGAVSMGVAHDSMKAATAPIGTPLVITDETITVIPPNQALQPKDVSPHR